MKLKINRQNQIVEYAISFESTTLLLALYEIKKQQDNTLTFSSNCRSGVCGACGVRVNGKEVLACSYSVKDGDLVEPLKYHELQRDLKVDKQKARESLKTSTAWLRETKKIAPTAQQVKLTEKQSDCILCNSCYSSCPVLEINPNFIGPFALTRAYRYIAYPKRVILRVL